MKILVSRRRDFEYRDIGFVLRAKAKDDPKETYSIEIDVISIRGQEAGGKLFYCKEDGNVQGDVEDINKADIYMRAYIKWDGCMEFKFTDQEHICGVWDAVNIGKLFIKIYEVGAAMMPDTCDFEEDLEKLS